MTELSADHEAQVRGAMEALGGGTVDGAALCQALVALNPRHLRLTNAEQILRRANRAGLLLCAGTWLNERCRIDDGWQRKPRRDANARGAQRLAALRTLWQARLAITLRSDNLTPSLGTVCGPLPDPDPEVMPEHIAAGIDAMHRSRVEAE